MERSVIALFLTLFVAACSGWQGKSLSYAESVAVQAREQGRPVFDQQCLDRAVQCNADGDTDCQPLVDCQAARRVFVKSLMALHMVVIEAKLALDLSESKRADEAIARALALAAEVVDHLKKAGVLK